MAGSQDHVRVYIALRSIGHGVYGADCPFCRTTVIMGQSTSCVHIAGHEHFSDGLRLLFVPRITFTEVPDHDGSSH
jgi:hypothetical protein